MALYQIKETRYFPTPNTAEYGFGDYSKSEVVVVASVQADSEKEAKKLAKKIDKSIRFSGINGAWVSEVSV